MQPGQAFLINVGDPTSPVLVLRGGAAGGADLILRYPAGLDLTLPEGGGGGGGTNIDVLSCNTLYIGGHARFVFLSNGVGLDIMDNTGTWIRQSDWTQGTGAAPGQPPTGWWSDTVTVNQTLYIGGYARFTALSNGLKLEVMDNSGIWQTQAQWTE
jgi:hypothetical protein